MSATHRIGLSAATTLLDYGATIDNKSLADQQLRAAVALHNMLEAKGVGYLADEVGMGKTLTALGVLALVRYQKPSARVLIIAPSANLQHKWEREWRSFVQHNVR